MAERIQLIDSILLGIPLPSIFVSQRADGVWELVDGLQRIGTILQLFGIMKDKDDETKTLPKLVLKGTKALPTLAGKLWSEDPDDPNGLTSTQRLLIKRFKIDVQIVRKESDVGSKYELFQRLNTMGSTLEPMEIRNCLLLMVDPSFSEWIKVLAEDPNFIACVPLSENAKEQMGDREMVARFLAFRRISEDDLRDIGDVNKFLDDKLLDLARNPTFNRTTEEAAFRETFRLLAELGGDNTFKRYDNGKDSFLGMFLVSAFEVIALGVGHFQPGWEPKNPTGLTNIFKELWSEASFLKNSGAGVRASTRVRTTIPLGRKLFENA